MRRSLLALVILAAIAQGAASIVHNVQSHLAAHTAALAVES